MKEFNGYIRLPSNEPLPQLLGIQRSGRFYSFVLSTFHLYEKPFYTIDSEEHQHNVFHIAFYPSENTPNEISIEGKKIRTDANTLILIPPNVPHTFKHTHKSDSYTYHELTFQMADTNCEKGRQWLGSHYSFTDENSEVFFNGLFSEFLQSLSGRKNISTALAIEVSKPRGQAFDSIFKRIALRLQSEGMRKGTLHIYETISEFLFMIINEMSIDDNKNCKHLTATETAHDYIEINYLRNPSLPDIAKAAGISPEHLCRKFKERYGITPSQYCSSLKIASAGRFLQSDDKSISEIAAELGYADVYTFSKAFKRITGKSPSSFRKVTDHLKAE